MVSWLVTKIVHESGLTECARVPGACFVQTLLEDAEKKLDELSGVSQVHGEFHRINSTYLQEIGDFGGYYKEALRYLGCVNLEEMPGKLADWLDFGLDPH